MTDATAPVRPPEPPAVRAAFPAHFGPVFAWGLTRVVRWRKVLLLAAVAVGFGVMIGLEAIRPWSRVFGYVRVLDEGILTFGLPLATLLLAAEGFSFEVQQRTLVYHLVRPVSRTTFFVARFLSGWVPAALVSFLLLAALTVSSRIPTAGAIWGALLLTSLLGSLALGAIYYTLGALLKNGLIAGLVYTFVVETMISSVPGSMQKLSVMFHVRSLFHRLTDATLSALAGAPVGPLGAASGPSDPMLGDADLIELDTVPEALLLLLGIALVALAFGAWRVRRRDFALKD